MVRTARAQGATQLLDLCPHVWGCWMRRIGYQTEPGCRLLEIGNIDNQVILMKLGSNLH